MFTTGSKWFFGLGLVSLVLAAAYGYTTGGDRLGPLTMGWYGGVGDHVGYVVLLSIATLAFVLGGVSLATRDADADALAQYAGTDVAPAAAPPAGPAAWPAVGALGAALVGVGLVISQPLFIAGLVLVGAALVEWMVLAWSDHATGDPATNRALRDRLMRPLEFPIAGAAFVALFIVGLSRLFLTVSQTAAWIAASIFALVVLGLGALVATRPKLSPNLVATIVVVGVLGVVTAGVISTSRGEREFHEHHAEEGEEPQNRVYFVPGVGIGGEPEASGVAPDPGQVDQGTAGDATGDEPATPDESDQVDIEETE
jgi:hypothetical protein